MKISTLFRKASRWLDGRETKAVKPPVPVPPVQPSTVRWTAQQLFCGLQYFWSSRVPDVDWFVANALALGFTGIDCEIMELVTVGDLRTEQARQIRKLLPWRDACRKHGMILSLRSNSNDKLNANGGMTIAIMRERIDLLQATLGTDGILFQPMSEDDSKTSPEVRKFAREYAATVWPKQQVVGVSAYFETHSAALAIERKEWTTLFVTDNSSQRFEQMKPADYVALANRHITAGNSFCIYGFQPTADWQTWGEIGAYFKTRAVKDAPMPPCIGIPVSIVDASGFREGAKLPSLSSMLKSAVLSGAMIDGTRAHLQSPNPFGEGAWLGMAWLENGVGYWSDAEGLHAGSTGTNYASNLFPNGTNKPGRCREKNGTAHYPRTGAQVWVFVVNHALSARTNIVFAGTQP